MSDLKKFEIPPEINVSVLEGNEVHALYENKGFSHAISYRKDHPRPDVMASVAEYKGQVIGIAGASADCELMWQIGVDVRSEHQGRGVGKAMVGALTWAILNRRIVPYYSTEVSDLQSRQLAVSLGYWPVWVELYARDNP